MPSLAAIGEELGAIAPSELVAQAVALEQARALAAAAVPGCLVSAAPADGDRSSVAHAQGEATAAARAALGLLHAYLDRTQGGRTEHLREAVYYESGAFLAIDRATRRNLELVEGVEGGRSGSLLAVVDRSVTAMGKRVVREWLLRPLADLDAIGARLDAVEFFLEGFDARSDLRDALAQIGDLERLAGRIGARVASPRDLARLAAALRAAALLRGRLAEAQAPALVRRGLDVLDGHPVLVDTIERALVDEPPLAAGRGALIRSGYHEEIDRLRAITTDGKGWMTGFEAAERQRTGIANLKVGYNKVFGYYVEVSRAMHSRVPVDYQRKQTVSNAERYITEELKHRESELLGAEERLATLESHLFDELRNEAARSLPTLTRTAVALAELDAVAGLAEAAHRCGHVRPLMYDDGVLEIVEGRHPVVEDAIGSRFVPNDCRLVPDGECVMVITGPNMAGKSTYLRQTALIALLAHCGAFVPAASARIGLLDCLFTRIGASDDLRRGQSTFMVEMTETAAILARATAHSLVVLDEIGRGTSTFDGISIAWAVAEAMVERGIKTLFATHYHELAGLAAEHGRVANYSVAVRRYKEEVLFLYRVIAGPASGSFGIEVARLAGVPKSVIEKARKMLAKFESEPARDSGGGFQPSLFAQSAAVSERADRTDPLLAEIAALDVDRITPMDALNLLERLVREARDRQH
jgi:DNA mismatch repair protein MutS